MFRTPTPATLYYYLNAAFGAVPTASTTTVLAYPMGLQESLDIHVSCPASPAGGEIVFLSWKELGLSVGLKRPPDVAES
jgi:hypothetical protein